MEVEVTAYPAWLQVPPETHSSGKTGINACPWFNYSPETLSYYFGYEDGIDTESAHTTYINNFNFICEFVDDPIFISFIKKDKEFVHGYLDIDTLEYWFSVKDPSVRLIRLKNSDYPLSSVRIWFPL